MTTHTHNIETFLNDLRRENIAAALELGIFGRRSSEIYKNMRAYSEYTNKVIKEEVGKCKRRNTP